MAAPFTTLPNACRQRAEEARRRRAAAESAAGAEGGGGEAGPAGGAEEGEAGAGAAARAVCPICLEREVEMVFPSCGHLCVCSTCGAGLRRCPMCRSRGGPIRVYTP